MREMRNRDLKRGGAQGIWLRSLRALNGLHQTDLADQIGISRSQLAFYEAGGEMSALQKERLMQLYPGSIPPADESGAGGQVREERHQFRPLFPIAPIPFVGELPVQTTLNEALSNAYESFEDLIMNPHLNAVANGHALAGHDFESILAGDSLYFRRTRSARPGQICLVERTGFGTTLDVSLAGPSGVREAHPDGATEGAGIVVAQVIGVTRKVSLGGRLWMDYLGFRPEDMRDAD